jgi:hypothetical protein
MDYARPVTGGLAMVRSLLLACLLAAAAPAPAAGAGASPARPVPLEVAVDPRIELLAVVQCLAGDGQLNDLDLAYRREVLARFAPWRTHPAVTLRARLARDGFTRDVPPAVMVRLAEPPALELRAPFTAGLEARTGGRRSLFALLDSLRDFAAASRFMEFHAARAGEHRGYVRGVRRALRRTRVVAPLESYFGVTGQTYRVILAPLLHTGGYAARVERPPGAVDCYAILGPERAVRGRPRFWKPSDLEPLLWHEFSHVLVGTLPDSVRRAIAADSALFGPLRARMAAQGYARWEVCAEEHLVRAVGVRLVHRMAGAHAAERELERQTRLGFAYLPRLIAALRRYERERERYPTFTDFGPELARAFHSPGPLPTERP